MGILLGFEGVLPDTSGQFLLKESGFGYYLKVHSLKRLSVCVQKTGLGEDFIVF